MFIQGKSPQKAPFYEPVKVDFKASYQTESVGKITASGSSWQKSAMIYYTLDPQFATLLFSVYSRNERSSFSVLPDAFCISSSVLSSNSILSYAHTVGLQLIALGEHYANFFSQVRAGSVIFLVGVGSLVCWKIWDYWNSGEAIDPPCGDFQASPPPKTPSTKKTSKTPTQSSKTFFASLLEEEFVHDFEEFQDEDPALIQKLLDLVRLYFRDILMGKYFGPESPIENKLGPRYPPEKALGATLGEDQSPLTSEYSGKPGSRRQQDVGDTSGAYLADDDGGSETSDLDEDNLPFDGLSQKSVSRDTKKVKRRKNHNQRLIHSKNGSHNKSEDGNCPPFNSKYSNEKHGFGSDISSSETSPRDRMSEAARANERQSRLSAQCQDSEANGTKRVKNRTVHQSPSSSDKPYFYANCNSDEEWANDEGDNFGTQEEIEKRMANNLRRSFSREMSLSDLMGRLRRRSSQRTSLSRDNSLSSRMSDFLRRDDSICSNLSDFAYSECSELSLELSIKDDSIADQTITSLADIEDELNTLKSSVLEIDEEFIKFSSRPNPYLLKTTFTDYSLDSGDSRPESALDQIPNRISRQRSRSIADNNLDQIYDLSSSSYENINSDRNAKRTAFQTKSMGELNQSSDVGSPQHEWTPSKRIRIQQRRLSMEEALKLSSQDEAMPSLEWDNGCLKQYEDELRVPEDKTDYSLGVNQLDRHKFLPDHSSLELDLEKELLSSGDSNPTFGGREILASSLSPCVSPLSQTPASCPYEGSSERFMSLETSEKPKNSLQKRQPPTTLALKSATDVHCNQMTTSIDSAIQSAPGSRSGSSSPVSHMTQSMMSSGIATSWSEAFETSQEFEDSKFRRSWKSEESGYAEGENGLGTSVTNLSPVHEVGEIETSPSEKEKSFDSPIDPQYSLDEGNEINGNNSQDTFINNNIMGNNGSSQYDKDSETTLKRESNLPVAVGEKQDILCYSQAEWQGSTNKAKTVRNGYGIIPSELNLSNLRKIRGDNYCGIRATLYQVLASGIPVPNGYQIYNRLVSEVNRGAVWLKEYSFGRRLTYSKDQVVFGFKECLDALDKFTLDLADCENKECVVISRLNNDPLLDIQICEAAKLHMLACALDLYKSETEGAHIPLFGMIMFARQSCLNPREFLMNHLNAVGDSAGLEQIEMFLLGHSLQVTLQVVRPSCFGNEDFICFYPDENIGVWPEVNLVAEDDRHYNVLVK